MRAFYASSSFMVVKEIVSVGRTILGILIDLSQDSRFCGSWLSLARTVFIFLFSTS